ncbi:hypothetical protein Mycch_5317 [Mycolicibacterium chubuense NBB4]|uniref:Anti-sigma-M factor RsmA n=1 Tax=Mycolicibacterium chubuense (strain NBB4) TaxID=710421 RepID=I4BRU4_MYCCN|nr:hypothetical protein [Mycolicibacterium chubuense]AFM20001.1 hypothetical protein Mycch_5317 [Mycolicibacterium chubuense NBB4]
MDSGDGAGSEPAPIRVTPDLLADLQAGLLDDATAARVRHAARTDPDAARALANLDTVRRELAHLGSDAASAPPVPAAVTARVGAALRSAAPPPGNHLRGRPALTRAQAAVLAIGIGAGVLAAGIGLVMLNRDPAPRYPAGPTASQITVTPTRDFPLSDEQVRATLDTPAQLGPLADPNRRAACLAGLGLSPTVDVLGGRELDVSGRPGVLLIVPGNTAQQVTALIVEPTCTDTRGGLLARTHLARR